MRFAALSIVAFMALAAHAGSETLDGRNAVILDGDTVAFGSERVRIMDIEAPGISEPHCEREEIFALRSRQRLAELIRSGPVTIERMGRDEIGRTQARLFLSDGRNLADVLVAEGLALPWQEGAEAREARQQHWCRE
jgi:endonuclease YncB( thermonuclease family)